MVYEFEQFRLDVKRRALLHGGREIALQPKVFDLLAYLVEHRERVIAKEELLAAVWPDVVVSDGSLKRAVSLARSALREGGTEEAIRTYPRQGYRFDVSNVVVASPDPSADPPTSSTHELRRAHDAFERCAWLEAAEAFAGADASAALRGDDLERWASARMCGGPVRDAIAPLERAVAAHAAGGQRQGAARAALWLAQIHFEQRELTVGQGWLQRATSYLSDEGLSSEHGFLAWLRCRFALADGELERGLEEAERSYAIGRELGDPNIEVLALQYRGLTLIALGQVRLGLALHDEAAAAVLSEKIDPWVGGSVYCGLIFTCRHRADWQRAAEWTSRFTAWCAQSSLDAFPGTCRLHRAEVLQFRGELVEAEREIVQSCRELADVAPWAEGDAHRVLGDLRLARGELDAADAAFRRAYELGWDPQPGLARLHMQRGRHEAALSGLRRSLADTSWVNRQRRASLLVELVVVATAASELGIARDALRELDDNPERWATPALTARLEQARAELLLAKGDTSGASTRLRSAIREWQHIDSPLNLARARIRLAELFIEQGDRDAAELELAAASACAANLEAGSLIGPLKHLAELLGVPR